MRLPFSSLPQSRSTCFRRLLTGLGIVGGIIGVIHTPALANTRPLFGISPTQVEQQLGPYWTRLTRGNWVTYAYNPNPIRRLYPDADVRKVEVIFRDHQAQAVDLWMSTSLSETTEDGYPVHLEPLYAYLFGDRPDPGSPNYGKQIHDGSQDPGGTLHQNGYCIGDGTAIFYEYASVPDFAHYISFVQNESCQEG